LHATPWTVAHLTFADGSHGIFSPTAIDLTFTENGQVVGTEHVSKHAKAGQVTCTVSGTAGPVSLSGTVTGKITRTH
jgi:hypothetical protein